MDISILANFWIIGESTVAESEGLCSVQPEASYHAWYQVTGNGSLRFKQGEH